MVPSESRHSPGRCEELTIDDLRLLIRDWKRKNSPSGHFKNQQSTIVTHQSMCTHAAGRINRVADHRAKLRHGSGPADFPTPGAGALSGARIFFGGLLIIELLTGAWLSTHLIWETSWQPAADSGFAFPLVSHLTHTRSMSLRFRHPGQCLALGFILLRLNVLTAATPVCYPVCYLPPSPPPTASWSLSEKVS